MRSDDLTEMLRLVETHAGPIVDRIVSEYVLGIVPCTEWAPVAPHIAGLVKCCDHKDGSCFSTKVIRPKRRGEAPAGGPKPYTTSVQAAWDLWEKFIQDPTSMGQWHWTFTGGGTRISFASTGWNEEEDLYGEMPHVISAFLLTRCNVSPSKFEGLVQEQIGFIL